MVGSVLDFYVMAYTLWFACGFDTLSEIDRIVGVPFWSLP